MSATECNYNDIDRELKVQFIQSLNDNCMMVEIISKLTKGENKDVTSNQVLLWQRWVEAQRMQTAVLNDLKVYQEFDALQSQKQTKYKQKSQRSQQNMCKYCRSIHPPQKWPLNGKRCKRCGKLVHFRAVYRSVRHKEVYKMGTRNRWKHIRGQANWHSEYWIH